MNGVEVAKQLNLTEIETLIFSGGGNRCWWQAGLISFFLEKGFCLPALLIGTSAGAAIAAACILDGPLAALQSCKQLFANNNSVFDQTAFKKLKISFAHQQIYPAWINSIIHGNNFSRMRKQQSNLLVAVARPSKNLGLTGSLIIGTFSYLMDKYIWRSVHPKLPKRLGLRQDFINLNSCSTLKEAQLLLTATASAPPFMRPCNIGGEIAIDGGYVDNVPLYKQTLRERSSTLILLTRHYPKLPLLFRLKGRNYWQPSSPIPVSTWDCTTKTTVEDAFSLGVSDAEYMLRQKSKVITLY